MTGENDRIDPKVLPALQRVRIVSHMLDNAFPVPGTRYRVGIDPFLGLIPGGGDTVGAILSAYIVLEALQLHLPRETVIQMVMNLLTDSIVGVVPFLGDLFDFGWKANSRNLNLLEGHLAHPTAARPADRWFVLLMTLVVIGIVVGFAILMTLLLRFITGLFTAQAVG